MKRPSFIPFIVNVCLLTFNAQAQWSSQKIVASDRTGGSEFGRAVATSGKYAISGAHYDELDQNGINSVSKAGSAYIFEKDTTGVWHQVEKIVAPDRQVDDNFGFSVAISGKYALVGSYQQDYDASGTNFKSNAGAVYLYKHDSLTGHWNFVEKWLASDRETGNFYGYSLSLSNDHAIVGAYYNAYDAAGLNALTNAGAAYIYELNTTTDTWSQTQKIVNSDRDYFDYFGWSVCIQNDRIIVGAVLEQEDAAGLNTMTYAGSAYIFEQQISGNWIQVEKIVANDRAAYDSFGNAVSIFGDYALVGVYAESEDEFGLNTLTTAGSAYIFKRNSSGNWTQVQKIVASDRTANDNFGFSVSICDSNLVVGSLFNSTGPSGGGFIPNAGAAYIFHLDTGGHWTQTQKMVAPDRDDILEGFGFSVAMHWNQLMIGSAYENQDELGINTLTAAGGAYIFSNPLLPTNVSNSVKDADFTIYPNPTSGLISIKTDQILELSIRNLTGQLVYGRTIFGGINPVDLSEFKNGVYLIELNNLNQKWIQKIIKID